ncbi:hypothetical protein DL546_002240 [Coniochaeta pulveracea]|uniref:Uncharacterized protein n=1 Tax=Coniochaeta pulveracea TaxID=177199 RepID=A0A420Y3Q6_9PEZI|nr:hypothetical protein DL546_002240 [Coniochaeta pulveracea]
MSSCQEGLDLTVKCCSEVEFVEYGPHGGNVTRSSGLVSVGKNMVTFGRQVAFPATSADSASTASASITAAAS